MEPARDEGSGLERALTAVPVRSRAVTGPVTGAVARCRWCAEPAAWSWTLADDLATDRSEWLLDGDCHVCGECQALTLGGDDAALLDRVMARFARRVPFPYASAFVREQEAARLAHWIARRTTFRSC